MYCACMMIVDSTCGPWYSVTLWSNLSGFWRRVWMSCWTLTQFFTLSHRSSSSIILNSPLSGPTTYYTFSTNTLLQSENFLFFILMKYHSQNRHIYSVFQKVTDSSLYIHQMFINLNNVFWNTFWGIRAIFFWLANAHMKGLLSYNSMDMLILTHTYNFSDVNLWVRNTFI